MAFHTSNLAARVAAYINGQTIAPTVAEVEAVFGAGSLARARRQRDAEALARLATGGRLPTIVAVREPDGFRGADGRVIGWRPEMGAGETPAPGDELPTDRLRLHIGQVG